MNSQDLQAAIVQSVADRGYLDGWNDGELLARQIVKMLEEIGELASTIETDDPAFGYFMAGVVLTGRAARKVFDNPGNFAGAAVVDSMAARYELADLAVVLSVMAHALGVADAMGAASAKARADAVRGVRATA